MATPGYTSTGSEMMAGRSTMAMEADTSGSRQSSGGRSSKRRTTKKVPDPKEYHLPTSASMKHSAARKDSEPSRPVYGDPQAPAQRQVSKAHSPLVSGTYTRKTSAAIGRGQLVTVQQAFAARKAVGPMIVQTPVPAGQPMVGHKIIGPPRPVQAVPRIPVTSPTAIHHRAADPDTRFRAFLARVGGGTTIGRGGDRGIRRESPQVPLPPRKTSIASEYAPSIGCASLDDLDTALDPDFLAEITKRHSLEAEEARESPSIACQDAVEAAPASPTTPDLASSASRFLTPDAIIPISSTRPRPPPRPPRSARRLSASPNSIVRTEASRGPPAVMKEDAEISVAFEDADETIGHAISHGDLQAPFQPSIGSSIPSTSRRPLEAPATDGATSTLPDTLSPRLLQGDVSHNITATFEDIVPDLPDPVQEDFERDRRLSSLLKGLGIQGLSTRPPSLKSSQAIRYCPSSPSDSGEQQHVLAEPASISSPEFTLDFTVPFQATSPSDESFANAQEGEEPDDWGLGYPDSPNGAARAPNDREPLAQREMETMCEAVIGTEPKQSTRRRRSTSMGSQKRARMRSSSQSGRRSRSTSFIDDASPGRNAGSNARASLGITDSVLASILASDSFYLPNGERLSMHELAARLSVDQSQLRKSLITHLAIPPESPGPGSSVMTASTSSRQSSMQYFGRPLSTNGSRSSWAPETPATQYFDDSPSLPQGKAEYAITAQGDYTEDEEDEPPRHDMCIPPEPAESYDELRKPTARVAIDKIQARIEDTPAPRVLDTPAPRQLAAPPSLRTRASQATLAPTTAPQAAPPESKRIRTLSVNAFQKLSNSFSGTSRSGKARKRLPSFFGGGSTPSLERGIESIPTKAISSDMVSLAPSSIRAPSPSPSTASLAPKSAVSANPSGRPRATTGPSRPPRPPSIHEIALAITGSPPVPPPIPDTAPRGFIVHRPVTAATMVQLPLPSDRTWRATIPDLIYDQISRIHSSEELLRQEIIFELCQTEESFVNGLKGVVKLFSQPLRTSHGKWIAGVPFNVSRLFDSLNDIVYLHSHLVEALRQNKLAQGALVLRFASTFMPYVSRLEVHQAYLIRFEGVTREIEDLARKPDSEFGEFVRMQQGLPECGAMTLSSFLLKPVQRLMKYPLFFKQLCDLTPVKHPDHYLSRELLESTDAIIRVMEEAKAREDEYEEMRAHAAGLGKMTSVNSRLGLAKMGGRRVR